MNAYTIEFNLNSGVNQDQLIQSLKAAGAEVIQTSSGLCFKIAQTSESLSTFLKEKGFKDLRPKAVDPAADLAPDVAAFLKQ